MSQVVLRVEGVTKRFGGFVALQDVALHLTAGERLGLIGPNGSGKTTLINCISGALLNDEGRIEFEGRDVTRLPPHLIARNGIARTFQIVQPFVEMTVLENVMAGALFAGQRGTMKEADDKARHFLVTSGGTDNTVDNVVAAPVDTNAASLTSTRDAIYQLARKLKQINDGLRTYGLFT